MKTRTETDQIEFTDNQKVALSMSIKGNHSDLVSPDHVPDILASEGNECFRHYIDWLGLLRDPKLIVLSSIHHYYYDEEEMTNVKTVVNLKELNHIKDINNFLRSMFLILPPKCYLIGCFTDNAKQSVFSFRKRTQGSVNNIITEEEKIGIGSRIPILNTIFSFLDARTNNFLSGKNVSLLLGNNGFKVIDMTELEGETYFCAQNLRTANN